MNVTDHIEQKAERILSEAGVKSNPIAVERIAKQLGLEIQDFNFGSEISGVLVVREGRGTIGVNADHHLVRRRFTIAHEIGHFVLHHDVSQLFIDHRKPSVFLRDTNSSTGERRQEIEANAFAAALLMPRNMVSTVSKGLGLDVFDDEALIALSDAFGVSTQAISLRLAKLGYLEIAE